MTAFLPAKIKACVEYLLGQKRTAAPGGMDALHQVLWYADAIALEHNASMITGALYIERVGRPRTRSLPSAIEALVSEGVLAGGACDYLAYHQADFKVIRPRYGHLLAAHEKEHLLRAFHGTFADGLLPSPHPALECVARKNLPLR